MTDDNGEKKRDRDPWQDRYDRDDNRDDAPFESEQESESVETSDTPNTSKSPKSSKRKETPEMSKSTKTAESEESGGTVRERKNVNMYLPEELVEDLQLRYSELNVEWRRQHGEDMPKNEEYYPAAIRAALGESSIEEELGVE
ncbi:hypothetical protein [Halorubrum persicum]|nr:hypothetical protein [Halorubrum persicum]